MQRKILFFYHIMLMLLLSSCDAPALNVPISPTDTPSFSASVTPLSTEKKLTTPTSFSPPYPVWFSEEIPQFARELILHNGPFTNTQNLDEASIVLEVGSPQGHQTFRAGTLVYVLAVAFPEIKLSESLNTLKDIWDSKVLSPLLMSPETYKVFSAFWGEPAPGGVKVMEESLMFAYARKTPGTLAILPFDHITPQWRVLPVDGVSPFDSVFSPHSYALGIPVRYVKRKPIQIEEEGRRDLFLHYRRDQMTFLALTGVTALARRTAQRMNEKGVLYPQQEIGSLLSSADLTHISNEVSFNLQCPPEKAQLREALFCSSPEYIQLLEAVGTDIVELTGNHNLDRGAEAYNYSLALYRERGWKVYGGGESQVQARQPLLIEHHGNRLALIGCNQAGPETAWAGESSPGAARCDLDWMEQQISSLRSQGILPVVTFQSVETEDYRPAPMQRPGDYLRMAQAGAVIVSGSQSHVPQGFSFAGDNLVHYGLGNLFFDQTDSFLTSQAFIDWHVFYQGKYLGVKLIPIRIEDYSRPRLMTQQESLDLLKKVFEASLW